jgi:hypothetical protein
MEEKQGVKELQPGEVNSPELGWRAWKETEAALSFFPLN